ncbi:hypothetical protein L1049_008968 [Liquidambar formosana]|uniref:Uncharacterized protein n=1 Tax=Liquidambar formosana TaxID=63359 RepID=A0AAP0S4D4_LIQFO
MQMKRGFLLPSSPANRRSNGDKKGKSIATEDESTSGKIYGAFSSPWELLSQLEQDEVDLILDSLSVAWGWADPAGQRSVSTMMERESHTSMEMGTSSASSSLDQKVPTRVYSRGELLNLRDSHPQRLVHVEMKEDLEEIFKGQEFDVRMKDQNTMQKGLISVDLGKVGLHVQGGLSSANPRTPNPVSQQKFTSPDKVDGGSPSANSKPGHQVQAQAVPYLIMCFFGRIDWFYHINCPTS